MFDFCHKNETIETIRLNICVMKIFLKAGNMFLIVFLQAHLYLCDMYPRFAHVRQNEICYLLQTVEL